MIRALGKIVRLKEGQPLTKHDFYLSLSDVLLDLVEKDIHGPSALSFCQRANSLAHDFIHLATLAGQLLWYVGVAPVRTGTADSLPISLTAESYLVFLRTACDVISGIIGEACIDPKKRGQVPADSLHDLIMWTNKNHTRVPDELDFLKQPWDWFMEFRAIRDKLIHFGHDMNIYTDAIAPSFGLMDVGALDLHFLRSPGQPLKNKVRNDPLMPFLKKSTTHVLHLADQVATIITQQRGLMPSQTHVLNGVYIPALNHILSYEEPTRREITAEEKWRAKIKAWYLYEAGNYLESLNFGYPDGFWLQFVVRVSELFRERPPSYLSKPRYPPYRDSEVLLEWRVVFTTGNKQLGLLLRDGVCLEAEGLTTLKNQVDAFKQQFELDTAVLVLNTDFNPEGQFAELIADSDPMKAAESAFRLLIAR